MTILQHECMRYIYATTFRKDCYKCITEMLEFLLFTSQSHPQAPSVPKSPGPPPTPDPNMLTNAEAEQYVGHKPFSIKIVSLLYK